MTVIAIVAARDMSCMLSDRDVAVMAGTTGAQYLCVVDGYYRLKHDSVVAVLTNIGRRHMCRTLARRRDAIMTGDAIAEYAGMVIRRRYPGSRIVTIIALVAAGYVVRCLTGSLGPIVTIDTVAHYRYMINKVDDAPVSCYVAVRAFAGRRDVIGRFRRCSHDATL